MAKVNPEAPITGAKQKLKAGLQVQVLTREEKTAIESFLLQAKIEAITPCPRNRTLH